MKDKIIVAIVCAFFISMVWISSTSNTTISNDSVISEENVSIPAEDTAIEFINYDAPESIRFNEAEIQTEISDINPCTLESIATDTLTFSEAFRYYRQCRGDDSSFQWKGVEYTTLLSKEVIIQMADSVKVNGNSKETVVSQIQ